jgi:hypothetical protein
MCWIFSIHTVFTLYDYIFTLYTEDKGITLYRFCEVECKIHRSPVYVNTYLVLTFYILFFSLMVNYQLLERRNRSWWSATVELSLQTLHLSFLTCQVENIDLMYFHKNFSQHIISEHILPYTFLRHG